MLMMRIARRNVIAAVLAALGGAPLLSLAGEPAAPEEKSKAPSRKPNIIVILADDLGSADLGCQGSKDIPTPQIDSLARDGVRFRSGYVSCPVCSPTRAGLITGRYQQRFGHEFNPGALRRSTGIFGLPLQEKTIADRLKALGYWTGMVGKWHLGNDAEHHPLQRGFDEYFGFLGGAHPYLERGADPKNYVQRGTQVVDEKEYLTDAFTREALAFIERNKERPFFLHLTYNAVHLPMNASQKRLDRFKEIEDPKRRTFASMLAALDDGIGAVLEGLRKAGLEENTLIFFLSDNGGPTAANTSRNDPLRGVKAQVWEGGIRVPFLVRWKGRLPAGKVYDHPVISLDILPTAIAAAGGEVQADWKLDGVNLLPYLAREAGGAPHETLYWRFGAQRALRQGDWKLVKIGDSPPQLFDLAADIGEKSDLAAGKPDLVEKLEKAWKAWNGALAEPLWGPAGAATAAEKAARKARRAGKAGEAQ